MNSKLFRFLLITSLVFPGSPGCSSSDEDRPCGSSSIAITDNSVCLNIEHGGLKEGQKNRIEELTHEALVEINKRMPIDKLLVRIVDNDNLVINEIGIGGYNPGANEVLLAVDTAFPSLDSSLERNFIPQLAHEIHHARRRRSVGYGNTLFQAMVTEGLADHFSIEIAGIDPPPWSLALTADELQEWMQTASSSWDASSYDHNAWFVGTDPDIPRWAGYSIGYELVSKYLSEHPGELPSTLFDEPADSFKP